MKLLKEVCIFIFGEPGQWPRLFLPQVLLEERGSKCRTKPRLLLNTQCQLGVPQLDVIFTAEQPFVLGAAEPQQPVVLFMRACLKQSAEFSIFPSNRREAGARPARHNNCMSTQHFMILAEER